MLSPDDLRSTATNANKRVHFCRTQHGVWASLHIERPSLGFVARTRRDLLRFPPDRAAPLTNPLRCEPGSGHPSPPEADSISAHYCWATTPRMDGCSTRGAPAQ